MRLTAGQTLALWSQPRAGQIAIYAAFQGAGGEWSEAELLNLGDWSVEAAASASAFAVVYNETDPVSGATLLTGRIHDGTGWSAPLRIEYLVNGDDWGGRLS